MKNRIVIASMALSILFAGAASADAKKSASRKKAPGGNPALIEKGRALFEVNCGSCHGPGGKGDGVAAAALDPKPRDLSDAAYMKTRSEETLRKVINEGGQSVGLSPVMVGWQAMLKPEEIDAVLAFVLSLTAGKAAK
jgi:mono/diheme cytochrome c family protein